MAWTLPYLWKRKTKIDPLRVDDRRGRNLCFQAQKIFAGGMSVLFAERARVKIKNAGGGKFSARAFLDSSPRCGMLKNVGHKE